ncbi:NlpC/P60 family protein [Streptomyces sp. NPDC059618]|uniref:C40 family peptidase n=1 Tax=Streptomyces sp. NPDC059618 TaxID=3346887 RepID=UPI003674483A
MAAHRKAKQRSIGGNTARTAVTIALAGAATATGFDGVGHADPQLSPAQVKAQVDKLYVEAEAATQKYDGAKEKAGQAEANLRKLRDEAARREDKLNSARDALGSMAAAQYRSGGLDPVVQLALSDHPDQYLEGAAFAERVGTRQSAEVDGVRRQLRELEQLRSAAHVELASLSSRQAELKRQKKTINEKLGAARQLLARLTPQERTQYAQRGGADDQQHVSRDAARGPAPVASSGASGTSGATAAGSGVAAPNSRAAAAIAYAYSKLGSPYVWGATGPDAFDCSGLAQAAYRSAGISLPRTTYSQINAGRRVTLSELQPGDLVFFYAGITHVGIYIGNGQMIHAPNPSAPVRVAPISEMPFAGATRVA